VLEEQNLFVIPLDQEGDWFRYHDLFHDFLRHRLKQTEEPAGLARLHGRASAWLAGAGLIEDALPHALAAGDERGAADLVEAQLHPLLNRQFPIYTLARWLDRFTEQAIQTYPGLLIIYSKLGVRNWRAALAKAQRLGLLPPASPPVPAK
jgi:ATP/maltotriose-dependent transcriptional regulator MalT